MGTVEGGSGRRPGSRHLLQIRSASAGTSRVTT